MPVAELAGYQGNVISSHIEAALALVRLTDAADRRIGAYSKGMQQRLAIALALLRDPELLILDEPTSGLDPLSQWEIRQLISALHASGRTILLCSHCLAEVEQLCDVVNCLVLVTLAIALCPPIATRMEQIGFLAWLVAAIYSYTSGPLAQVLEVLRLPLLPFGAGYNSSVTGVLDWSDALALVIEVYYIAGLIWLAESRMARRDLVLE